MSEDILIQGSVFLITILCGAGIRILYDGIRIFRRIIRHNHFIIAIEDILFWVISSVIMFLVLYYRNDGIIRGFAILGMVLGMLLYHWLFSKWVVKIISRAIYLFIRFIHNVFVLVLKPIKQLVKLIMKPCHWLYKYIRKKGKLVQKRLKKDFRKIKITISKK